MLTKTLHLCCSRLKPPPQTTPQQCQNTLHIPSFKNFNSLYDPTSDSDTFTRFGSGSTSQQTLTTDDVIDTSDSEPEPDLSTVIASRRLTRPASTGRSNSIVDGDEGEKRVGFGAVPTMSPDPYGDFKRSIEEMVAALGIVEKHGRRRSGDHHRRRGELSGAQQRRLQELLLCYLALNGKSAHKYIVGAFAEVIRGLGS